MNLRRISILLVLVLALAGYLFFYEVPQAEKEAHKEKLLGVDKDAITAVTLTYPDREIELKKVDGAWRLAKPVDAPAEDTAVKAVINTLADAEVQKKLDELPQNLADFGLEAPTVTARVTLKDGSQSLPLVVGKNTAIGGKTYVRKGDEKALYLTTSSIGVGLNKQAKDLRDKTLLAFTDDDVNKVEITGNDGKTTTLVRKDKDAWTVQPGGYAGDVTEVRSYLSSLRATRAADFPDDAPADLGKYGLATPRLVVAVTSKKNDAETTRKLLVGGETPEGTGSTKQIYAKRDDQPSVYAIGDWSYRSLAKTPAQFRDKTVLGFDPARVKKLVIGRQSGDGVTAERAEGGGWAVESAGTKKPKNDAITRYLDDLRDLRGAEIAAEPAGPGPQAQFGLDKPNLSIALTDKENHDIGTILATKHDGKYYVMRGAADTIYEARDYMFTRLDKQRGDFLESEAAASATTLPPPPAAMGNEPPGDEEGEGEMPEDEGEGEE